VSPAIQVLARNCPSQLGQQLLPQRRRGVGAKGCPWWRPPRFPPSVAIGGWSNAQRVPIAGLRGRTDGGAATEWQIRGIEIILTGNPNQGEQGIAPGIGEGGSHSMRGGGLSDRADRPVRGDPFAGRMGKHRGQAGQPSQLFVALSSLKARPP
jgi:hypothetical protein